MINENLYDKNGGLIFTNVGQIIHSTTLDTEEKVKAIYGGVRWQKIEGRFLLGQSSSYAINSQGGEEKHTLTALEMPSHSHQLGVNDEYAFESNGGFHSLVRPLEYVHETTSLTGDSGGNQPHNNMPPYRTVYIWERVE